MIDSIITPQMAKEERLLAALDFVQEQVRYLGLEMGEGSHRPSPPEEVLDRRFGDCKDKARLLVSLLRDIGIEAYPALVDTESGAELPEMLPSQRAFDHVIVLARLEGRSYWLDPTRLHQSGDLDGLYQPDYDYALVVSASGGGLRKMSSPGDADFHACSSHPTFSSSSPTPPSCGCSSSRGSRTWRLRPPISARWSSASCSS